MDRRAEGADTELRAARSEWAPGHVRLGVPSNLPAELSTLASVEWSYDLAHRGSAMSAPPISWQVPGNAEAVREGPTPLAWP